ncbi:hypothetical protein V7161_24215, partial [Neobacillus drentensis]|uniref:hypothetical protein n=1 Tax=Neobacillus drentensis TaxID=220684 RepID=UPI003003518B
MKKLLTLLFGGLIALTLFVSTGNTAKAEGIFSIQSSITDEPCHCEDVVQILGAERNKIVSDILKNEEYKDVKHNLKKQGYKFDGAHVIEVYYNYFYEQMIVGIPVINEMGNIE